MCDASMASPALPSPPLPSLGVFKRPAFALFWTNRLLGTLGVQIESVAIGWQVYAVARLTNDVPHSAFLVGMVGLVQFLPLFALTLIAGETADRYQRRMILIVCIGVEILCAAGLAVLSLHPQPSLVPLFCIAGLFGAARAFFSPASGAMGPMLVTREELPKAVAWSSLAWQGGSVVGPLIGGLLLVISPFAAYLGTITLYAGAIVTLLFIRVNTTPVADPRSRIALIREGLAYVRDNKIVLGAISLDLFAVLLGGATALLPVFARDVLHVGQSGFGILRAGPAIGAALVAFALSRRPLQRKAGLWMFGGVAVFALASLVFAVSKSLWLSVFALAVLGGGDMISVYVRQTLVQIVTPDAMRGRVSAVSGVFIGASNELGEFETGLVARLLGPVGAALFGGFGSLVVVGLWAKLFPQLRKADRLTDPTA
ncbi:MFS transporter [soil metagenome]